MIHKHCRGRLDLDSHATSRRWPGGQVWAGRLGVLGYVVVRGIEYLVADGRYTGVGRAMVLIMECAAPVLAGIRIRGAAVRAAHNASRHPRAGCAERGRGGGLVAGLASALSRYALSLNVPHPKMYGVLILSIALLFGVFALVTAPVTHMIKRSTSRAGSSGEHPVSQTTRMIPRRILIIERLIVATSADHCGHRITTRPHPACGVFHRKWLGNWRSR
jgi:hypothetical protein